MMNDKFRAFLFDLERENNVLLSRKAKPHLFGNDFNRRALAVCRGEKVSATAKPRRLPVGAAVAIIIICAAMIITCAAAAVSSFFGTAAMSTGFLENGTDIAIHGTTKSVLVGEAEIVSIIHIKEARNAEKVEFIVKASSDVSKDALFDFRMKYDEEKMPVYITNEWESEGSVYYSVIACAKLENREITFLRFGESISVKLENISDNGYELLSEWPVIDGVEIKMLPVYSDNRLFYVSNDIESTTVKITDFTVYNEQGNSTLGTFPISYKTYMTRNENGDVRQVRIVSGADNQYHVCTSSLKGDISKIEINSVQITRDYDGNATIINIPSEDGAEELVSKVWLEYEGYSEEIVKVKREGNNIRITIKRHIAENSLVTECEADIPARYRYNDNGDTYEFYLSIDSPKPIFTLQASRITYTMKSDEEPLGVILLNKR